jgi:predicted peptidase
MRNWIFLTLLFSSIVAEARTEQTFRDPVTGKSGLYTAAFAQGEGLLLFFHGSGNTAAYASSFESLQKVARTFRLVPVALQAPNQAVTWPEGPNAPDNRHVDYVKSFLEREIHAKHPDIKRDRLILAGYSAGATFLSGDLLPAMIGSWQGGAVMLCGGGGPVKFPPDVFKKLSPETARKFPLYFMIQQKDFLYPQTMQGISYWKSREALVQAETPAGGGHCAFNWETELTQGIRKILDLSRPKAR